MRNQNDPDCFGKFEKSSIRCRKCEFRKSCSYYRSTEAQVEGLSRLVSLDNSVAEWLVYDPHPAPGEEVENEYRNEMFAALARILRWILSVDNYTLGIVAEMVDPEKYGTNGSSVATLARSRGITRQSMHEKMLHAAAEHPELAALFQTTLRKVGNLHSQFRRIAEVRG